jgi:UDP-glucose:(heptosyl)LPS alpha-1,3-glucosyltransferase
MKILFTTRYFGESDGVGRYSVEIARLLMKQHDVTVLTSKADILIPGLHYKFIHVPIKPFFFWECLFTIKSSWFVFRNKKKYDVVHTQKTETLGADMVTMHSCHKAGIETRNSQDGSSLKRILRKIWPLNILRLFVERRIVKTAKIVAAVSTGVGQEIEKFYGRKDIEIVFNGVDTEIFSPGDSHVREKYNISEDKKLLLFVGNGYMSKGLNFVLDALEYLGEDFHLLVVGRDTWRPEGKNISVETKANPEDISTYYKAADCFVFPSLYEAFPLVVLEALASSVPVVVSGVNGVTDCIVGGKNGHIVERNGADIAFGIKKIFRDDTIFLKYKNEARETSKKFTWESTVNNLNLLYERINHNSNSK